MLASSAVDRVFESRSGQTKNYKICICCFSAKHAALSRKSNDWLARNQENVSEWCNMSIRGVMFQWANTMKIQRSVLSSTKWTSSSFHWRLTCSWLLLIWQKAIIFHCIIHFKNLSPFACWKKKLCVFIHIRLGLFVLDPLDNN
jgi:hypothetical protein